MGVVGALALLIGMPPLTHAQESNPTRCQALQLKKESAFYDCVARCDGRVARGRITADECEQGCQAALDAGLARVGQSPPCQPQPTPTPEPQVTPGGTPSPTPPPRQPDPEQCEARLLQIQARGLFCHGRCAARAERNADYDQAGCVQGCDTRCQAAADATMADPVCSAGRAPAGEMRQAPQ